MKIYKFRYRIYYDKLGRNVAGVNHHKKIIMDAHDRHDNTLQFYHGTINNPLFVMRGCIWDKGQMPTDIKLNFDLLRYHWLDRLVVVEFGRFMSGSDARTTFDSLKFMVSIIKFLEQTYHTGLVIITCKPGLINKYLLLGFKPYTKNYVEYPDGFEIPLAGFIDKAYAKHIQSPLKMVLDYHPEIIEKYYALFSNPTMIILDKKLILNKLQHCLSSNPKYKLLLDYLRTSIHYGAFILVIEKKIKICHKNMLESDVYFLLKGTGFIQKNGSNFLLKTKHFITSLLPRRKEDIFCQNAQIFVLKKSCLARFKQKNPNQYKSLLNYIKIGSNPPCITNAVKNRITVAQTK